MLIVRVMQTRRCEPAKDQYGRTKTTGQTILDTPSGSACGKRFAGRFPRRTLMSAFFAMATIAVMFDCQASKTDPSDVESFITPATK